jgi:hypothetical protein
MHGRHSEIQMAADARRAGETVGRFLGRLSSPSQSTPLGIGESNAMLSQTLFEDSILLLEILDDLELLTVDPVVRNYSTPAAYTSTTAAEEGFHGMMP